MEKNALLAQVRHDIIRNYTITAGPLGALISIYYALWGPLDLHTSYVWAVFTNLVLFVVFVSVAFLTIPFLTRRILAELT